MIAPILVLVAIALPFLASGIANMDHAYPVNMDPSEWTVTSPYGDPRARGPHGGVDLAPRPRGKVARAVHSPATGSVFAASGRRILISDHGGRLWGLYHLDLPLMVQPGRPVRAGDVIGSVGDSPADKGTTGVHLHLQVKVGLDAQLADPLALLARLTRTRPPNA